MFAKIKQGIAKWIAAFVLKNNPSFGKLQVTDIEGLIPMLQALEIRIDNDYSKHVALGKRVGALEDVISNRT